VSSAMSKYFKAMQQSNPWPVTTTRAEILRVSDGKARETAEPATLGPTSRLCRDLASDTALHRMAEQLAPLAVVNGPVRVLVTGCRAGDGASTIAGALALDLSQRLGVRTILLEGHPNYHALRLPHARVSRDTTDVGFAAQSRLLQPTGWPHPENLAHSILSDPYTPEHFENLCHLVSLYQAAVMDLGVVRLDARVLNMAKPEDPVLIVVRHGQTERRELTGTVNTLRVTKHTIAGVVLNGYKSQLPSFLRWFLGNGG
jgi:hypothetical protein